MIDATTFAHSFNGFWQVNVPTCEHFVRRINLSEMERVEPPMDASGTRNRAVIAEFAFSVFVERKSAELVGRRALFHGAMWNRAWKETEARLMSYVAQGLELRRCTEDEEIGEVKEIERRLQRHFRGQQEGIVLRPVFRCCGIVDASEGDLIANRTILEVKTVDRPLRGADVRQVVTYAALNSASSQFTISKVGIINPRRGQYWEAQLDRVCEEISGMPTKNLLDEIVYAISSGDISR